MMLRICWPFMGDQPGMASYLEHSLDVAFQLVETRTAPHGLKPIRVRGNFTPTGTIEALRAELDQVLEDMQGNVGARKRANARRAQADLATAWAEGGSARLVFEDMCSRYGL
jgi:hypothetical protein